MENMPVEIYEKDLGKAFSPPLCKSFSWFKGDNRVTCTSKLSVCISCILKEYCLSQGSSLLTFLITLSLHILNILWDFYIVRKECNPALLLFSPRTNASVVFWYNVSINYFKCNGNPLCLMMFQTFIYIEHSGKPHSNL